MASRHGPGPLLPIVLKPRSSRLPYLRRHIHPHARHDSAATRATQQRARGARQRPGGGAAAQRTKVQVARPALADDLVKVAVLRRHVARAPPELRRRRGDERARAAWPLRREHAARGDPDALQRPRPGPRVSRIFRTSRQRMPSHAGRPLPAATPACDVAAAHQGYDIAAGGSHAGMRVGTKRHLPCGPAGRHRACIPRRRRQAPRSARPMPVNTEGAAGRRAPQLGGLRMVVGPAERGVLAAKHAAGLRRGRRAPALRRAQQPQHIALHLGRRARGWQSGQGMRS